MEKKDLPTESNTNNSNKVIMQKEIDPGFILLALFAVMINYFWLNIPHLVMFLIFVLIIFIPQIQYYFFDPKTWQENKAFEDVIKSLRYRAVLYNNISIAIFVVILIVIFTGFYFLVTPPVPKSVEVSILTVQIGSSVLLIFLVGILFRVFKYLLRVASFYNAKADALDYIKLQHNSDLQDLEKLITLFVPEKYDMSELDQPSIASNLFELIKGKLKVS